MADSKAWWGIVNSVEDLISFDPLEGDGAFLVAAAWAPARPTCMSLLVVAPNLEPGILFFCFTKCAPVGQVCCRRDVSGARASVRR